MWPRIRVIERGVQDGSARLMNLWDGADADPGQWFQHLAHQQLLLWSSEKDMNFGSCPCARLPEH